MDNPPDSINLFFLQFWRILKMDYPSQVEIRLYCEMANLTSANNIKKVFLITGKYCSKVFAWMVSFQDCIQTKGKLRALIQYVP